MLTSDGSASTAERPDDEEHDYRADDRYDDAFDVDAGGVLEFQEDAGEPTADDRPDDPQDDRADQPFTAADQQVRDEAGDRAEHDPGDDAHGLLPPWLTHPVRISWTESLTRARGGRCRQSRWRSPPGSSSRRRRRWP